MALSPGVWQGMPGAACMRLIAGGRAAQDASRLQGLPAEKAPRGMPGTGQTDINKHKTYHDYG